MAKDDIDWDDPEAVAAARGDNPEDDDEGVRENLHRTDEEQAEIDAKAEEDKKADKDAKAAAKKADEDKAAADKEADKEADAKTDDESDTKAEDDDKGGKKEAMIPKSRFDAKNRQNKALQDQIDKFHNDKAAEDRAAVNDDARGAIENELVELDKAINKAISDDKMDDAAALRGEVRTKERELWQMDMDESSDNATTDAREQVRLDMAIDHIEATHDEFNPDSEDYSQEVVDKVQELRNGFVATGKYSPTQALLRAMDFVLPKKAVADTEAAADDPEAKAKKEAELRKAGLKKATDAANKTPADAKGTGDDSDSAGIKDEINVDKLSYEDIASLPEATLKRMRGDIPA